LDPPEKPKTDILRLTFSLLQRGQRISDDPDEVRTSFSKLSPHSMQLYS